jgi:transcriptional regulator with AAA-type ATPase domain
MLFRPVERTFAERVARYMHLNPFGHADAVLRYSEVMSVDLGLAAHEAALSPLRIPDQPYIEPLLRRVMALLNLVLERCAAGSVEFSAEDIRLYDDLLVCAMFFRFRDGFDRIHKAHCPETAAVFRSFRAAHTEYARVPFPLEPHLADCPHGFACLVQIRRAFLLIKALIRGNSRPAVQLRAAVWNSICPHEMRLYGQLMYDRMHEVTTLILGPSGTGKELVATAIGLMRYIPFDAAKLRFTEEFGGSFHAVNLSALSRDLIESEMFGHCAGAFTGAVQDRVGWFELCRPRHTVFLDEIGELDAAVQVKLLRVLQSREFHRVGETEPRQFHGKLIAATNRDLAAEIAAGTFRQDLYYRLCSDIVTTPSLRAQLDDCPSDLPLLVRLVAAKCLGNKATTDHLDWLAQLTVEWIERSPQLGWGYSWPGNFRELEQCVRNVMVRGQYHPLSMHALPAAAMPPAAKTPVDAFVDAVRRTSLSFDELLEQYCSLVFARSGNLAEAARRLDKHRATVQSRIRDDLVTRFTDGT